MKPYKRLFASVTKNVSIAVNSQVRLDSRSWIVESIVHINKNTQHEGRAFILKGHDGTITIISNHNGVSIQRVTDYDISCTVLSNVEMIDTYLTEFRLEVSPGQWFKIIYNWQTLDFYFQYVNKETKDVLLTVGTSRSYLAAAWTVSHITELGSVVFTRDKPSDDIRQDEVFIRVNDNELAEKFSIKFKE